LRARISAASISAPGAVGRRTSSRPSMGEMQMMSGMVLLSFGLLDAAVRHSQPSNPH
jgi:hypothetical protein